MTTYEGDHLIIMNPIAIHISGTGAATVVKFLPARRYASAAISRHRVSVSPSVCHKPTLYQNG